MLIPIIGIGLLVGGSVIAWALGNSRLKTVRLTRAETVLWRDPAEGPLAQEYFRSRYLRESGGRQIDLLDADGRLLMRVVDGKMVAF